MPEKRSLTEKIRSDLELLQRHVTLLKTVKEHQPIGIIRLSEKLGLPQHKVRYTLRVLEREGLVLPSPEGAVITDDVQRFLVELKTLMGDMSETIALIKNSL